MFRMQDHLVWPGQVDRTTWTARRLTKELRCNLCGKLLAEKAERGTVIICARCKTRNEAA